MRGRAAVNIAVVLLLGAAVFAVPGGGDTADLLLALLSTLVLMSFAVGGWQMYRAHRYDLYSLGDPHRGALYGAIAAIVFALAGRARMFATGGGTLAWFVIVGLAALTLSQVLAHWRRYR